MRRGGLIVTILLTLLSFSCTDRDEKARRLHAWCEVHLDELTWPVMDLREVTGLAEPIDACELWLVDPLREDMPEFEHVLRDRWGLLCEEEIFLLEPDGVPPDWETCNLLVWVDPVLIGSYRDGVLHCRPAEGEECRASPAGTRTHCDLTNDEVLLGLGAEGDERSDRNILSVMTFESSPGTAAVVWNSAEEIQPWISWVRVAAEGAPIVEEELDVCAECRLVIGDSEPRGGFVAFQTAGFTDESVLLAGPCGAPGVVELHRDGQCELHPLLGGEEEHLRNIEALGVMATTEGYVALWSEGQRLWITVYGPQLQRLHSRVIWQNDATLTRAFPTSVCLPSTRGEPDCVVLWTSREHGIPGELPNEGDSTLVWNVRNQSRGDEPWQAHHRELAAGFGGTFAISSESWDSCDRPMGCGGLFVFRHPSYGLLARSWIANSIEQPEGDPQYHPLAFSRYVAQLADGDEISEPALVALRGDAYAVGTVAQREPDQPREMSLTLVGGQPELRRLVTAAAIVPGFAPLEPTRAHEVPLVDRNPSLAFGRRAMAGVSDSLLLGAVVEGGEVGCELQVAIASAPGEEELPADGEWPFVVELTLLAEPFHIPAPWLCQLNCRVEATWLGDRFIVALPSEEGVRIVTFTEEDEEYWEMEEIPPLLSAGGGAQPTCRVALRAGLGAREEDFLLATDFRGQAMERGIALWRGRRMGERWEVDELPTEGVTDVVATSPAFAAGFDQTPLLTWSEHPFRGSDQRDVGVGIVRDARLEDGGFPYRDIVDVRPVNAVGSPVPCDGYGSAEGDNLCAIIATTRPEPTMEELGIGPLAEMVRTPVFEVITTPLSELDERCPECSESRPVFGSFGEESHGFPMELFWWDSGPLAVIDSMPLHGWQEGVASLYQLAPEDDGAMWSAWQIENRWLMGEEHQNLRTPALRTGHNRTGMGGIWSRRGYIEGDRYTVEYYFSLLSRAGEQVWPASGSSLIDGWAPPEADGLGEMFDTRSAILETLDSGIAAMEDDLGYLVAWVDEQGVNIGRVTCREEESRQAER